MTTPFFAIKDGVLVLPLSIVLFIGAIVLVVVTYGVIIWLIVNTVKNTKVSL